MYFYMYVPCVKFYNLRLSVGVKMCGIGTVNGTLGKERRFGNELRGSEFKLVYITSSCVSIRATRPQPKQRKRMSGNTPQLTSALKSSYPHFTFDRTRCRRIFSKWEVGHGVDPSGYG
jgi:hypothetical protein